MRWKRGGHQEVGGSPPALKVSDSTEERSKFKGVHLVKSCPVSLLVRMIPFPRKMPLSDIPQAIKKKYAAGRTPHGSRVERASI